MRSHSADRKRSRIDGWRVHAPAIVWGILIFILSSIPSLKAPELGFRAQDKLAHCIEFGFFGFLLRRSMVRLWGDTIWIIGLTVLGGIFYGALDEFHQSFVSGREASLGDFLADSIGILLAQLFYLVRKQKNFSLRAFFY